MHNKSLYPYTYNIATFYSFVHRLLSIPSTLIGYKTEVCTIKQIACNNGYNPDLINDLIFKVRYKRALNEVFRLSSENNKYFHVITFKAILLLILENILKSIT